ncbi:MAG: helix-turn-helix domain-containing protein [Candidatus Rokuibacteriota bacterium]
MRPRPTPLPDWYMTLDELAEYSRISRRQLERYLHRAVDPLPHVRNGRRILVLKSAFDAWIAVAGRAERRAPPAAASDRARSADEIIAAVRARHAQAR